MSQRTSSASKIQPVVDCQHNSPTCRCDDTVKSTPIEEGATKEHERYSPETRESWEFTDEVRSYDMRNFIGWACQQDRARPSRTPLWTFTQLMRTRFPLDYSATKAFSEIDAIVTTHRGWEENFRMSQEAALSEFTSSWPKVRYLPGCSPVEKAMERATLYPVQPPPSAHGIPTPGYGRFISLAVWLQIGVGEDDTILLPMNGTAETLQTTPRMVHLWTKQAVKDGVIERVKKHVFRPGGVSLAAKYRITKKYMPGVMAMLEKSAKP